jgi:hypothetical protein
MADDDDLTLYEPVLGILSGGGRQRHSPARPGVLYGRVALGSAGQGQATALQHAVFLVPGRKPGRTCAKIVYFKRGSRLCNGASLQHAVLLVPGRKPGRTCAKIVHFNPGVSAVQLFSTRCSWFGALAWPDLSKIVFSFNPVPWTDCGPSASSAPDCRQQTGPDLSKNCFSF